VLIADVWGLARARKKAKRKFQELLDGFEETRAEYEIGKFRAVLMPRIETLS